MRSFVAQSGQNIYDIAAIAYGDSNAIFQLLNENPSLNINANTYAGTTINYTPPVNNTNYAKQQLSTLKPATGIANNKVGDYLLQEDGFDFDLESGTGKIELE